MPPIRIAHITTIDLGLRHLLFNQLLSLKEEGYDVTGISSPGPDVSFLTDHGIRHIAVPMTRSLTPLQDVLSFARLFQVLRRERFDIVHTHNPKPGLLGQIAARAAGTPIVVNTLHGFYFHDGTSRQARAFFIALEKMAARCSDRILSQSAEDVETAVVEGICPVERIIHLGNGINISQFDPERVPPEASARLRRSLGIHANGLVVGFVGRLVEEKGVRDLLQAARLLTSRGLEICFLFVGPADPEKADAVGADAARRYGVQERCIFTGMRYDLPDLYTLMDVCVLPSHREGFPRVPMEASAMGVPVVATDIRGCREAVIDGVNGVLVPVGDAAHLADALSDLLTDGPKRRAIGLRARALALERFDERRVFEIVKRTYADLHDGRASSRLERMGASNRVVPRGGAAGTG